MWGRQVRGREGDAAVGERRRQVGHACQLNGASTGMGQRKGEKERAELGWGERGEGRPRAYVGRSAWAGLLGQIPGFGFFYFISLFYSFSFSI